MQNFTTTPAGILDAGIPLQQIVNNFMGAINSSARQNKSAVMVEIDNRVKIGYRNTKAISIINELVETVVRNSKNGEIHITADRFSDLIIFQIEERNNYNGYALSYSIGSIEPEAAVVGGHITIKGARQKVATISFTFPNSFAA